jgi:hypothetical protein
VGSGGSACGKTSRQLVDESTAHGFYHRLRAVSHLEAHAQQAASAAYDFLYGGDVPVIENALEHIESTLEKLLTFLRPELP